MIPSLEKLWQLTGEDISSPTSEWNMVLDPIGLILIAPPHNWNSWCTPKNTITFATTGGDSVHYGLLAVNQQISEQSPIVMTVPMSDTPNTIVGESFRDFLALGCRIGYFVLEQLVYDRADLIGDLESRAYLPEVEKEEMRWLKRIEAEFGVEPWPDPLSRLEQLGERFSGMLMVENEEDA